MKERKEAGLINEYDPDTVTSPHLTILETMEARKITLGSMICWMRPMEPEQTKALLRGEIAITLVIAIKLEAALGLPVQFWLNRQKRYSEKEGKE